jgi:hypothetical protein
MLKLKYKYIYIYIMTSANEKLKIIESNMLLSDGKGWTKLSKTEKLVKFSEFAITYCEEQNIEEKKEELERFLKKKLDQKRLVSVKELDYNTQEGIIISIYGLEIIDNKFVLLRAEKRSSTLKSLAPKKKQTVKIKLNGNKKK